MGIPLPPQNVILQTGNQTNLVIWNASIGAVSYLVQRSTDGLTFSPIGTPTVNNYLDSAVLVGVDYYYQVASVNSSGTSSYSQPFYPKSITPCLPGQINLGYIRYMVQLKADKLFSQYLTTDEWNFNVNQSANELYDLLVDKFGDDYFFAPALLITMTGVESYPIPDGSNYIVNGSPSPALYKLNGLDVNCGGGTGINAAWIPLARANWSDRDRFTLWTGQSAALNGLYQMSYRPMGSNIFIFPSNQNLTLRMWYVPILTQMLLDTDMLPFSISGWSEYVIVDAAMKAMVKEESFAKYTALQKIKDRLLERIETTAANRDVGQPNSISNTRRTMGDPGFGFGGGGFGGGLGGMSGGMF